jgi:hypothetical protein
MVEMISVVSRNVRAIGYESAADVLVVTFRSGGTYRYLGVSPATFRSLLEAKSKGHFLNTEIKDRYPYARVA